MFRRGESDRHRFDRDRAAVFANAIVEARRALKEGEPDKALAALDRASDRIYETYLRYLRSIGMPEDKILEFIGR